MSLANNCRGSFPSHIRSRGDGYFAAGRVEITSVGGGVANARVRGSGGARYLVRIESLRTSRELDIVCDCPYADDGFFCKHAWATIRALDAAGLSDLNAPATPPDRTTRRVTPFEWAATSRRAAQSPTEPGRTASPEARREHSSGSRSRAQPQGEDAPMRSWRTLFAPVQMRGWPAEPNEESFAPEDDTRGRSRRAREIWWSLSVEESRHAGAMVVNLHQRERGKAGNLGALKRLKATADTLKELIHPEDRQVLELLLALEVREDFRLYPRNGAEYNSARIGPAAYDLLLPRLCETGRFVLERAKPMPPHYRDLAQWGIALGTEPDPTKRLLWSGGEPWRFRMRLVPQEADFRIEGVLTRTCTPAAAAADPPAPAAHADLRAQTAPADPPAPATLSPSEVDALPSCRLLLHEGTLAPLQPQGCLPWLPRLKRKGPCLLPRAELEQFLRRLWERPEAPRCDLSPETGWRIEPVPPRGHIEIHAPDNSRSRFCRVDILADYGERSIDLAETSSGFLDPENQRIVPRDRGAEREFEARLDQLRIFRSDRFGASAAERQIRTASVPEAVRVLVGEGWMVKAERIPIRSGGRFKFIVSSGIDWFDLEGALEFDGASAQLPDILNAVRKGNSWVLLDDGSHGMIPQEWLARFAGIVELGEKQDGRLRFRTSQAVLLDALLESEREVELDAVFTRIRDGLRTFAGIEPSPAPAGFQGILREYQKIGLGWLSFLRGFGLGGCLADDMGLGKTIQVLALFESLRKEAGREHPFLVVAPRSLIHNWIEEAARFTPELRVLDHTGLGRTCSEAVLRDHDLVITTYGTLRRDILELREISFDYVVLDEAQAIKNADSQSAKASRLLRAANRLALTGTPIENRLEELWSIFEFLNPGMLGSTRVFERFMENGPGRGKGPEGSESVQPSIGSNGHPARPALEVLARAIRPFLLRRTKEAVLTELPPKTEQTVLCELKGPELHLYNKLRDHFRASLSRRIQEVGWNQTKIHVLESLLRLRQAACHPGLLDPAREGEPSAKLDTLLQQVQEVASEGHKALVFSQFTRFLAIVRARLDAAGIRYEYLDGRTRDRKARVHRFQENPDIPLFLISLKAGGQGLNLTAADYVFLLDPWWNPAVEAQAIDRTHRIGQSRKVFAYRLVARNTVEEKILDLQKEKRALSDAILAENEGMLRKMTAKDLEMLLGA